MQKLDLRQYYMTLDMDPVFSPDPGNPKRPDPPGSGSGSTTPYTNALITNIQAV